MIIFVLFAYLDALRLIHQIGGFISFCFNFYFTQTSNDFSRISFGNVVFFTVFHLLAVVFFGEMDQSRFKTSGKFEVGYTEFTSDKRQNKVSVYYPINQETYAMNIARKNV